MRTVRVNRSTTTFLCGVAVIVLFVVVTRQHYTEQEPVGEKPVPEVHLKDPPTVNIVKKQIGGQKTTEDKQVSAQPLFKQHVQKGNQACRLPDLSPDAPGLRRFFKDPAPLECSTVEKNWVHVKKGRFYIDEQATKTHGDISCNYTNFWRVTDDRVEMKQEQNFKSGSALKGDFFKVQCKSVKGASTYTNVHAGIAASPEASKRHKEKNLPSDALGLNVYIAGFDSISRMTFIRKLPKLYKYLTEDMEAIVLEGYNIVGDGTPQALIPIFTGKTEVELPLTRKRFPEANYVNVYPFVWNEYRDAGYATLYGEDAAQIGTFTYRLKGFKEQPTDHYMRTFYMVAENEMKNHKRLCWGSEEHHKTHFDYVQHFWDAYPGPRRKFAFQFHSYLSHDNIDSVGLADDYMVEHMKYFVDNGHMNNTILVVMSDHGHRFANLRETQQGKLEERLPFFSFSFPLWFKEKYPEAIRAFKTNARRLTTPFDIHATLKEIIHFDPHRKEEADLKNRELSLFHEIPIERTCADAGIEPHWCTCLDWTDVPVDDPMVVHISHTIVQAINKETQPERKLCSELKLVKIEKAAKYAPATALLSYKQAKDTDGFVPDLSANSTVQMEYYQLDIWTSPGRAHYEAQATLEKFTNRLTIDLDLVSHVNKYGDLPHCIIDKDYFLAKWCVCFDKI